MRLINKNANVQLKISFSNKQKLYKILQTQYSNNTIKYK